MLARHVGLYSSPGLMFLSLTVQAPSMSSLMRCPVSSPPTPNHWKFQPFSLLAAKLETSPGRWRRPSARHWRLTQHSYRPGGPALRPSSRLLQISRLDSYELVFRLHGERQDQCSDYTYFRWETLDRDVREYVAACTVCAQIKSHSQHPAELLKPLTTPHRPWSHIMLDCYWVTSFIWEVSYFHHHRQILLPISLA